MKEYRLFTDQLEATLSAGLLESHGIRCNIVGAKEYLSHATGAREGRYVMMLDEENFARADEVLARVTTTAEADTDRPDVDLDAGPPNYFKRAIIQATLAMIMLPLICNVTSLWNGFKFWRYSEKSAADGLRLVIIILLQIPSVFLLKYLMKSFFE